MAMPYSDIDPNLKMYPDLCLVNQLDLDDEIFDALPSAETRARHCVFGNCALRAFKTGSDGFETLGSCEYEEAELDSLELDNRGDL